MFIKVTTTDREGGEHKQLLRVASIDRVRTLHDRTVISQSGQEYDIYALETQDDVETMISETASVTEIVEE